MNAAALPAGGSPGRAMAADAAVAPGAATDERVAAAWRALALVEDPEIPALTLVDLGIVRFVTLRPDDVLEVGLSPTYTGCPATEFIRGLVEQALAEAQVGEFAMHPGARARLDAATGSPRKGDASSPPTASCRPRPDRSLASDRLSALQFHRYGAISQFGSTPCKSLHRCRDCLEPFECFKCI